MKSTLASLCLMLVAGATELAAQTVQLPSTHYFATSGSVIVPDQGRVFLGGVNRASSGQSQFGGLPGNRSRSSEGQASGASVTAFVHDFEAHDQALLAEAARRRNGGNLTDSADDSPHLAAGRSSAARVSAGGMSAGGMSAGGSVAEIERQRRAARQNPQHEAEDYFAQARRAQETGKPRLARVYYQMAARRATGELKERALAQVAAIGSTVGAASTTAPR